MPWIEAEDNALKKKLSGITVADLNARSRDVQVWFRHPEQEERNVTWPFITIELVDIVEAFERAHRGVVKLSYLPEGLTPPEAGFGMSTEFPIPVDLHYAVTTHARSAQHDRQLHINLLGGLLPLRFGSLYVEEDDTVRRLDHLGWQSADMIDRQEKRVFRKIYRLLVSSEVFPELFNTVQQALRRTVITSNLESLNPVAQDPAKFVIPQESISSST